MSVQVLLSCMNQSDFSIVEKSNIQSDAIIVNQTNFDRIEEKVYSFGIVKMISTTERGLSKSRNMALRNADADIYIIADDDEVFEDDYVTALEEAYRETSADVLIFNVKSMNTENRPQEKLFTKPKRINKFKSYSSVHVSFKKSLISEKKIWFNEYFGSGSGYYSMAEDSLFFEDLHRVTNNIFTYPVVLAKLYCEKSSWFKGFNAKYFFDTGAFLAAWNPRMAHIYKWYYFFRLRKKSSLKGFEIIRQINSGIRGYDNKDVYKEC